MLETKSTKLEQWDYNYNPNFLSSSEVEYTLTFDCFLNTVSSDQIGQLSDNARAKYSISFECGDSSFASEILSMKSSKGTNLIFNFKTLTKLSKSSCEKLDLDLISSLLFSSSANILNGAKNSASSEKNIFITTELSFLPIIKEKSLFASIINFILESDYIRPFSLSSLEIPSLTFLPSSNASFSVNLLL